MIRYNKKAKRLINYSYDLLGKLTQIPNTIPLSETSHDFIFMVKVRSQPGHLFYLILLLDTDMPFLVKIK